VDAELLPIIKKTIQMSDVAQNNLERYGGTTEVFIYLIY